MYNLCMSSRQRASFPSGNGSVGRRDDARKDRAYDNNQTRTLGIGSRMVDLFNSDSAAGVVVFNPSGKVGWFYTKPRFNEGQNPW